MLHLIQSILIRKTKHLCQKMFVCLLFGRYEVRLSVGTPIPITELLCDFSFFIQRPGLYLKIGRDLALIPPC